MTEEKRPDLLLHLDEGASLCDAGNSYKDKVVIISADDLKPCLGDDYTVLYIWKAKCPGEICKSLNASQILADSANVELFIIAEYYDAEMMGLNYIIEHPILGIDTEYYKSEWTNQYVSKFLSDLLDVKTKAEGGLFILLKDKNFVGRYNTLEETLVKVD